MELICEKLFLESIFHNISFLIINNAFIEAWRGSKCHLQNNSLFSIKIILCLSYIYDIFYLSSLFLLYCWHAAQFPTLLPFCQFT